MCLISIAKKDTEALSVTPRRMYTGKDRLLHILREGYPHSLWITSCRYDFFHTIQKNFRIRGKTDTISTYRHDSKIRREKAYCGKFSTKTHFLLWISTAHKRVFHILCG